MSHPTLPFQGDYALDVCSDIGRSYHRTDTAERVNNVRMILQELAVVMVGPSHNIPPAAQVAHALQKVEEKGNRCWGASFTWSRRRTVADLLLIVYHEPFRKALLREE